MNSTSIVFLDCTLRDGGYYNDWDFPEELINSYLRAMSAAGVNVVEVGLRSLKNSSYKGACAYSTDSFINGLNIPNDLQIAVMVNASELVDTQYELNSVLTTLFPKNAEGSKVGIVRIACHVSEFEKALPASSWLKARGYKVCYNLMQIVDCTESQVKSLSKHASAYDIDALYFADSLGSMDPAKTVEIISWLKTHWHGAIGIHTHDNLGMALQNTLAAMGEGVTWVDSTVTGMGRGPGNAKTEYLALEITNLPGRQSNLVPLMELVRKVFQPMQHKCGWGTNTYYYLAGKYGIHPTYIQEMLNDSRYSEEDILAVINRLRDKGAKKFTRHTLDSARDFYEGTPRGTWKPSELFKDKQVLLIGTGPGVEEHRVALEEFIRLKKPLVVALNAQEKVDTNLIDVRIACHPVRLLADCVRHTELEQPLITPASMLPQEVRQAFVGKQLLDFGIEVCDDEFGFYDSYSIVPSSLVIAYALAVVSSGEANELMLAGFDGYSNDLLRNQEINKIFKLYFESNGAVPLYSITKTRYDIPVKSVYGLFNEG